MGYSRKLIQDYYKFEKKKPKVIKRNQDKDFDF